MDGQWMVTEYDVYGRAIKTGLNTTPTTVSELWHQNFYDGERINLLVGGNFLPQNATNLTNPLVERGKLTGSHTAVLNGNQATNNLIERFMFYDDFGRLVRETGDNHREGILFHFHDYDFADNIVKTRRQYHISPFSNQRDTLTYTFDHQGRSIDTHHNLDKGTSEHLCRKSYDHKDLLLTEFLGGTSNGFLQECNYTYLENRFLKGINATMASDDLFSLQIGYDQGNASLNAPAQYDGNIASLTWQFKGGQSQTYGYQYDFLNRLTATNYNLNNNAYGTTYSYDLRGNFTNLQRRGVYSDGTSFASQQIDNMNFTPISGSNKIQNITDTAPCPTNKVIHNALDNTEMHAVEATIIADNPVNENASITYQAGTEITLKPGFQAKAGTDFIAKIGDCPTTGYETDGFVQRSTSNYLYDANGNQINDPNKGITTLYNYHNLPYKVTFANGNSIDWLYSGSGAKLQKRTQRNNLTLLQQDYFGNIEYRNDTLEALYFDIGRLFFEENDVIYEYSLADHLGNQRVLFADKNGNGMIEDEEVSEISAYYPFGMRHRGSDLRVNESCDYLYNGIERNTDFGLNLDFASFRTYDPSIGRWLQIDPLAEFRPDFTSYRFGFNNPVLYSDPLGLFETRKEAKEYKKEHGAKGRIRKQKDGSFAIENKKEGTFTTNDSEFGVMSGALVTAKPTINGNPVDRIAVLVEGPKGGTIGGLDLLSGIGLITRASKLKELIGLTDDAARLVASNISRVDHAARRGC